MVRRRRQERAITADDVAEHGSVFDTSATNVNTIATQLGVSATSVRRAMRESVKGFADKAFERLSGRKAASETSPASMLQAVFGPGPRGGAVNAAAAAKKLGVAPGTVRRWAAGTQKPSADHLKQLQNAAKRATGTPSGRRRVAQGYRSSRQGRQATQRGGTVFVTGYQGPRAKDDEGKEISYGSTRWRTVRMTVDPADIDTLLDAYEKGVEQLKNALTKIYDRTVAEWEFLTIDDFGIDI
jgi:hypothetical protein